MGKVIDVHVHLGDGGETGYAVEDSLRVMDANGIDHAIIGPHMGYPLPLGIQSSREQNDFIANALKKWPDRFLKGYGVVDPRHGRRAVPEVDRILGELGLCGLMFENDRTGMPLDSPIMYEFMEHAAKYKDVVVFAHTAAYSVLEAPFMLEKLAKAFPEITFINGCALSDMTHCDSAWELSANNKNIYLEISGTMYELGKIAISVEKVGADKIIFGSDAPFYKNCREIKMVNISSISEEDKEKILYGNAIKIFHI